MLLLIDWIGSQLGFDSSLVLHSQCRTPFVQCVSLLRALSLVIDHDAIDIRFIIDAVWTVDIDAECAAAIGSFTKCSSTGYIPSHRYPTCTPSDATRRTEPPRLPHHMDSRQHTPPHHAYHVHTTRARTQTNKVTKLSRCLIAHWLFNPSEWTLSPRRCFNDLLRSVLFSKVLPTILSDGYNLIILNFAQLRPSGSIVTAFPCKSSSNSDILENDYVVC